MDDFERKNESELEHLDEDALLDYLASARDFGALDAARTASGLLAFRYLKIVTTRVRAKTPDWAPVDDIVMEVMQSAIRSSFDGKFVGQYRVWIHTITRRRIADFLDEQRRKPRPLSLDGGGSSDGRDDDGGWEYGEYDDEFDRLPGRELAEQLRAKVPNEMHRCVIHLYGPEILGYGDLSAQETQREVKRLLGDDVSEANIHQIWRRFAADLRKAWEDADAADGG